MAEIKTNTPGIGQIQIADEVLAVISGTAAMEVEGIANTLGNITGDLAGMFGKKNMAKGVKISVEGNEVTVDVAITVKFGYKVHEVAQEAQQRIKTAIETMTGLTASSVNVSVAGVMAEKEPHQGKEGK